MRMLIDHFGNQVEDDFVPVLPDGYDNLTYQRDAVVQGYDIMMQHGGCFIADVVGLGKTVVAAMIAQRFIAANGDNTRILVIFPPAVRSNWEETFRDFGIKNKYSRFISNGSLDKIIDGNGYDEKEYYDLVIVDEAHNFRHDSNINYDLLQRITKSPRLNKGNVKGGKKVLLLSATPLNNTPEDIKNQLLLFQDTARCTLDGIGNIADTFAPWIKEFKSLMSQRRALTPEMLTSRIDAINQEMRHTVLEKVMVRRTRSNIQHEPRYADEIHFPALLDPEDHTYQMSSEVLMLFVETYKKLVDTPSSNLREEKPDMFDGSGLRYARYRAVEYCPKYNVPSGQKASQLAEALAGIYRTHMVKRLESSFDAFKKSLHTLLDATEGMIKMFRDHRSTGKEYYESIMWADMVLNSGLAIMPTKNLINNLGATNDSTHYSALPTMNHRMRRIFTMPRYELDFPLKHPKYVIENVEYKEHRYKVLAWNHPWTKVCNSLEELWLNLKAGNFSFIGKSLTRRIRKWTGRDQHK